MTDKWCKQCFHRMYKLWLLLIQSCISGGDILLFLVLHCCFVTKILETRPFQTASDSVNTSVQKIIIPKEIK